MRIRRVAAGAALVAVVGIGLLPDVAHACAMCFSGSEETRKAFFATAAFLTLLPLGMLAGMTAWLRGRARRVEAEAESEESSAS
jgi:hypothetical protein